MKKLSDYQKELISYIYHNFVATSNYGKTVYLREDIDNIIWNVKEYYDNIAKKKSIIKCISYIKDIISSEGFRYYENNIQLNDNHTIWEIKATITGEEYWALVNDYLTRFEEETGIEVFTDGRSNRHIVVKDTIDNFINYQALRELQIKYEKELINYINNTYPIEA